jgi:hypothetical protein
VVKDAPDLFSHLVVMNTALPTGVDLSSMAEMLKV